MGKHVELDIEGGVSKLIEKVRGKAENPDAGAKKPGVKEEAKSTIWLALSMAVQRIATARDVGELTEQMVQVKNQIGSKGPAEIDGMRAAVMFKLAQVIESDDAINIRNSVEQEFKKGNVGEAIRILKDLMSQDKYKVHDAKKKQQIDHLLSATEKLDRSITANKPESVLRSQMSEVVKERKEVSSQSDTDIIKLREESEIVERSITREQIKNTKTKASAKKRAGKVEKKVADVNKMITSAEQVVKSKPVDAVEDLKFMRRLLDKRRGSYVDVDKNGDIALDIDRLNLREATLLYGRINTLRGRYKARLTGGNKGLGGYLDDLDFELREHLLELRSEISEGQVAENMVPGERQWEELPYEVRAKLENNMDFVQKHGGSVDDLLNYYNSAPEGKKRRKQVMIEELIQKRPELRKQFRFDGGDVYWNGEAEDFFELCRREVYKIKSTVPEEQLGQLVFVEEAQTYMALMGVNTEGRPDLKLKKEAVTTSLYMEFALKSLWKAGGNHEAWKRASGMILRDGAESNFFIKMRAREKIRVTDKKGNEHYLPGFNVNDIMTMAELKAPNGQSWHAYISPDNIVLAERRLKEYGQAMALFTLEKAKLRGEFKDNMFEYIKRKNLLTRGELKINEEQLGWMRDYTHYMLTSTLRVGEDLTLFDATEPGAQDFDYVSGPGGQFAQKTGIYAVLYYAFYGVTKYNYEAINNKLFMPLHGLLSYARGETLSHFLFNKSNETWLKTPEGGEIKTGKGANDFFFKGAGDKDLVEKDFNKFWEDVWLDDETGSSIKMKGLRAIHRARAKGQELMRAGRHRTFVNQMDFTNLEALIGYEIPGATNEQKLQWTVENLDYDMLQMESMPSKREGDFVNKYSEYFVELTKALQEFLNAPGLAGKMKIIDIVDRYNNGATTDLAVALDRLMDDNSKSGYKLKPGGKWWNPFDYKFAATVPSKEKDKFIKSADGAHLTIKEKEVGLFDNYYLGKRLNWTRQDIKEGTSDPLVMKKIKIQNMIAWGLVDAQEGAKLMREWQKDIYFGKEITIGRRKLRPGMIPLITPFLLFRGWWVDRLGLDWEDFMIALRKNNEEAWAKLKKIIGI